MVKYPSNSCAEVELSFNLAREKQATPPLVSLQSEV